MPHSHPFTPANQPPAQVWCGDCGQYVDSVPEGPPIEVENPEGVPEPPYLVDILGNPGLRTIDGDRIHVDEFNRRLRALIARADGAEPEPEPTPEEARAWWRQFRDMRCPHCGGAHARGCPRVRRIRFNNDGTVPLEVEYWPDGRWNTDGITWPEDLPPDPDQQ
jgi:ferredoxin